MKDVILSIKDVNKYYSRYGYLQQILNKISLDLYENEFLTILGPVGSGKSTLIKILAGVEIPTAENCNSWNQKNITKLPLAYIPSAPSSLPWFSVEKNIEYYIKTNGQEIDRTYISKVIDSVGLAGYEKHIPDNKSLGFRFRISMARALAARTQILLIDEPFIKMDDVTRKEILILLRNIKDEFKLSVIYSTSNISEAVFLSDRLLILGNNPTSIIGALNIDLPVKRDLDTFATQLFFDLLKRIELESKPDPYKAFSTFQI